MPGEEFKRQSSEVKARIKQVDNLYEQYKFFKERAKSPMSDEYDEIDMERCISEIQETCVMALYDLIDEKHSVDKLESEVELLESKLEKFETVAV